MYFHATRNRVSYRKNHARNIFKQVKHDASLGYPTCTIPTRGPKVCYSDENVSDFSTVMRDHSRFIQPTKLHRCTVLLTLNLAETDWVSVDCHQKLLSHAVCFAERNRTTDTFSSLKAQCKHFEILVSSQCYSLFYFSQDMDERHLKDTCGKSSSITTFDNETENVFHIILSSTSLQNIYVATQMTDISNETQFFSVMKTWSKITVEDNNKTAGLFACTRSAPTKIVVQSDSLVSCSDGKYVSTVFLCDAGVECNITSEESQLTNLPPHFQCRAGGAQTCSPLMYRNNEGICKTFATKEITQKNDQKSIENTFKCSHLVSIPSVLVNDFIPDCGLYGEDEHAFKEVLGGKEYEQCLKPKQLPCVSGHPRCYDIVDICIFRLNQYNLLSPCRTGSHIESCSTFQCHSLYKCPGYYCIPWGYFCDGKWDCPQGLEEKDNCMDLWECDGHFNCHKSHICVPIVDVCDDHTDCPHGDDEVLCELNSHVCPQQCFCLNFAVMCQNIHLAVANLFGKPYIAFHVVSCKLPTVKNVLTKMVLWANFSHNELKQSPRLHKLIQLFLVDISNNQMEVITKDSFVNLPRLSQILLPANKISVVEEKSFSNLKTINLLDLHENNLTVLETSVFEGVSAVHTLNLKENKQIHSVGDFNSVLIVDQYHLCCNKAQNKKCLSPRHWYSSCEELLPSRGLEVVFPLVFVVILISNSAAVICSVKQTGSSTATLTKKKKKTPYEAISKTICLCDCLCGFYLLTIFAASQHFSQDYPSLKSNWTHSPVCVLAFSTSFLYIIGAPVLLSFLSYARLQVVVHPFDSHFKSFKFVAKCLLCIVSVCVSISVIFSFLHFTINTNFSGLCIPYVDPTKDHVDVLVFIVLTLTEQTISIVFIVTNSVLLVKGLNKSRQGAGNTSHSKKSASVQLVSLSLSNVLSWLPSTVAFLALNQVPQYPLHSPPYIIVISVPLNAVLVPVVFSSLARGENNVSKGVFTKARSASKKWTQTSKNLTSTSNLTRCPIGGHEKKMVQTIL